MLTQIINKITDSTPYYIFDINELKTRINRLKEILPDNTKLCYAIKANPFLLNYLKDEDLLFEVCSPGELSICEKYKVSPDKIIFSGVCKTQEDVERAYFQNVKTITLESSAHCEYFINCVEKAKNPHQQEVILRLSSGNQFGMSSEDIINCIQKLTKLSSVTIRGIHYFTGTQKKLKKIEEEIVFIQDYCKKLMENTGIKFDSIEYGPGLSYDYFSKENEKTNFDEISVFSELIKTSNFQYVIELGRYIASSCGTYVTQIMDLKTINNNTYCIIDGGINHINYYGQMMGMKIPEVEQLKVLAEGPVIKTTICGSLCTTADIVLRELELNNPSIGDKLIFKNIGAYSITEGIYLFLSHPLPAVYIIEENKLTKIRKHIESFEINS